MRSGRVTKIPLPFLLLSKDEGLRDIGHSMSIGNLILGVNSVTVSYLIHYDSLLQNATEVYDKMRQLFYYKIRELYYKMQHLLQIATVKCKFTFTSV